MKFSSLLFLLPLALAAPASGSKDEASKTVSSSAKASATKEVYKWDAEPFGDFTIHKSCNTTEKNQLKMAINEAKILANHAKEHTIRFGTTSKFFKKYFGNSSTAEVIGWYDMVSNGDHSSYVFRCDDPEDKCSQDGWAGYWVGAFDEKLDNHTSICPISYTSRLYLHQMCAFGNTVAGDSSARVFAADMLHRFWHTGMGQGFIEEVTETYNDVIELAKKEPAIAVRNSQTLRYYALDVYAYDITIPGKGCTGKAPEEEDEDDHSHSESATKTSTSEKSSATKKSSKTSSSAEAESTSDSSKDCHTHKDGTTHCV